MASTYLTSSYGSTTNRRTWTYSFWIKRAGIGAEQHIWGARNASSEPYIDFRFESSDIINFYEYNSGSYGLWLKTNRKFTDCSGWYHIVVAVDTTQAVASDRIKLYINGVQETSFSTETYPAEDFDTPVNVSGYLCTVASLGNSGTGNFSGAMSHFYFIDGLALAPTVFGSTDATSGEWTLESSPSVTYGNNGFFILKDGNTITDQSGNGHNWTVGAGTLTDLKDCPDDVFSTMNPLVPDTDMSFINGNNTQQRTSGSWDYSVSTLGANTGKYYFEGKIGGTGHWILGATSDIDGIGELGNDTGDVGWRDTGGLKVSGSEPGYSPSVTYTSSDVVCVAMDKTNNKIYFRKNGDAWINSGDPTSGATGTGAFDLDNTTDTYFFGICSYITSGTGTWDINFGNGYFGTTAISSEGTNASGIGKFEYDVPTGYTALSTKGLQE